MERAASAALPGDAANGDESLEDAEGPQVVELDPTRRYLRVSLCAPRRADAARAIAPPLRCS